MQIAIQFQSTLPQGERQETFGRECKYCDISIHAPARGATLQMILLVYAAYFNPRSRKGSDTSLFFYFPFPGYFNPRSRKGSDLFLYVL